MESKLSLAVTSFQAKNEYIIAINEINAKYQIPNFISEMILHNICCEIKEIVDTEIKQEIDQYNDLKVQELKKELENIKNEKLEAK